MAAVMRWLWERPKRGIREDPESHLRIAISERIARGEDPTGARTTALREFGNLPLMDDVTRLRPRLATQKYLSKFCVGATQTRKADEMKLLGSQLFSE